MASKSRKGPSKGENYGPRFYRNPTPKSFAPYKFVDFPKVPALLLHTCWFDNCMKRINPSHTLLCKYCGLRFCTSHERRGNHVCLGPIFLPYPMRFKMFSDRVITTPTPDDQPGPSRMIGAGDNIQASSSIRMIQIDGEEVQEEEFSTSSDDDDSPKKAEKPDKEDTAKVVDKVKPSAQKKLDFFYVVNVEDIDSGEETDDEDSVHLRSITKHAENKQEEMVVEEETDKKESQEKMENLRMDAEDIDKDKRGGDDGGSGTAVVM